MPGYLVRMSYDILVSANSPEEAISQIEEGIQDEPLYGPFNYEVFANDQTEPDIGCYFAYCSDPEEYGEPVFLIALREFWDKHKCLSDQHISSPAEVPASLMEIQESVFRISDDTNPEMVKRELLSLGYVENTELLP